MTNQYSLPQLGWNHFFQQQLSLEEWESCSIARVIGVERSQLILLAEAGKQNLNITHSTPPIAVGDWILLTDGGLFHRLFERSSLFSRKAAGTKVNTQLIAANVDTAFIVCSMNMDFNLNRIERYLALTNESGADPVIVLTKADCCENPQEFVQKAQELDQLLNVIAVNSLDKGNVKQLDPWCNNGKTIAFLGSSGVGKSTLINTLLGSITQETSSIREDDSKGRHTTTSRSLHLLESGGLLLDSPGMRELQLADCEQGVEETFSEIVDLATTCRFADCTHTSEPGCNVREAIANGSLDERRLLSYQKLMREQAFNSATLAEKRAKDKEFGKMVRSVMKGKQKAKDL
ncbi:MAG: ribosome small subunit-dependent GTPase A [Gammaproteobacteria bacterium]|nr:MAG: ribosome small subunit-dependent GTPase A [Gammaproteobacteria bacterium]